MKINNVNNINVLINSALESKISQSVLKIEQDTPSFVTKPASSLSQLPQHLKSNQSVSLFNALKQILYLTGDNKDKANKTPSA